MKKGKFVTITSILQPEIPHMTRPYIDDVPVWGPASRYILPTGEPETIPENPGIRWFIWEHFQDLNRVVQHMKYCGGTFSGFKTRLCVPKITVLGHRCTFEGWLPNQGWVEKVVNWGPCKDLTNVRAFLGTIGVCRLFIQNFAHRAHHLVKLIRKGTEWEFGQKQLEAMADLKDALVKLLALKPIDYHSNSPVILSVDTSHIAIRYLLSQCDPDNPQLRYYAKFGSITLNDRESRFSQPKLELYGLFRTLQALKLYLIGVWNLIVEVDANETVIFPFTKTPLTLNFKLLSATHRAPSTQRLIDNTCHHPPAIHISPLPSITFQKATPAIPDRHGRTIAQNILVW